MMVSRYNVLPSYKYIDSESVSPVIEKSAGKPLRDYKIYGNSYQKKYGGKNLFNGFELDFINVNNRCSTEVLEGGILRLTNVRVSQYTCATCYLPYSVSYFAGKSITLSFKTNCSNEDLYAGVLVTFETAAGTLKTNIKEKFAYGSSELSITIQITEELVQTYEKIKLSFYTNASSSAIGKVGDYVDFSNIQLEISDSATEYEEYIPTPSSDYPQIIECVGDRTKNLFDVNKFVELIKAYDSTALETVIDGRRCISFRNDRLYHKDFSGVVDFQNDRQYIWSMEIKHQENLYGGDNDGSIYFGWIYDNETYDTVNVAQGSNRGTRKLINNSYITFTRVTKLISVAGRNVSQIGFSYGYHARWLIDLDSIQIEEGIVSTEYEPYGKYKVPVSVHTDDATDVTTIYLNEPLRRVGKTADYIDFKNQKIVRNVYVLDETGTMPIEESYGILNVPLEEHIQLPIIGTDMRTNGVNVNTKIKPYNVLIQYYRKG